jgi:hypothetical protein
MSSQFQSSRFPGKARGAMTPAAETTPQISAVISRPLSERGEIFFWLLLLAFVASTVVGALLSPHPRGPQPSALGDFSVPTAEEGRAIPVVFGTVMIKGGNTVWWGDLKSKPVRPKATGLNALPTAWLLRWLSPQPVIGFQYFLGCQFMLCHGPVDALVDIQADVKSVPRTTATINNGDGSENYIQVTATGDNLFGGTIPGGSGGISGIINFYRGLQSQQPDAYLSVKQGRLVLDQSGIGYTYAGVGNGTITAESAGTSALDETITITAAGIDGNPLHSTYQKMRFTVTGSRSGGQSNSTLNSDGSNGCWADQAFSCPIINMTIQTGSTQYANGDTFTIHTQHSTVAPAYRGMCYAVFKQLYVGMSSYLKPLAFVVRRCPNPFGQDSSVANISGDANGALAVYDLLTNVAYGLGIPAARIDSTSFANAALTLGAEALGISMQFDTQASADQLIGEILRHIDGLLYTDPATGFWTIMLARGGYDATTLPLLTVDNVLTTPDFSRGSWSETTNLVTIKFLSRSNNFNTRVVRAYDAANVAVTGEVRPQTIEFNGIGSEAAAELVAIRVLKTLSYPLSKIKLAANRSAWAFRPGGLFRFTWIPLGIVNQVFRITRIGYGELTDGKISIDAVEDIFGINNVAFIAPPSSGWINPVGAPAANLYERLVESPPVGVVNGASNFVLCLAAQNPATTAKQFEIWRDDGSGYFDTLALGAFCPVGLLSAIYPLTTPATDSTGFVLSASGGVALNLLASCTSAELSQGKNLCMVDDEIMAWKNVTLNGDGTYTISTVLRGLMDTVPVDHAAGAKVWFFSEGVGLIGPIRPDRTVTAKLLPANSLGTLPIASASPESLTTRSRAFQFFPDGTTCPRPFPPGNFRMQGAPYGTRYKTITGDLVLTFAYRNVDIEAGLAPLKLQDDPAVDVGQPAGYIGAYKYLNGVIGGGGVATKITPPGASFTYTAAQRYLDGGAGLATVKVVGGRTVTYISSASAFVIVYSTADVESLQAQQVDVTFTGFGFRFGEYFGGITS